MNKIKYLALSTLIMSSATTFAAPTQPFTTSVDNVKVAMGNQNIEASTKRGTTTLVSPRTGISYTLGNTEGRPITFQTDAIAAANNVTVKRIVASNPALSAESQVTAEKALLDMPEAAPAAN